MIEFCSQRAAAHGTRSRSPATTSARPGSTAAQELAFTLADGIAYVERASTRGLDVDDFAPRLSFFFNAHKRLLRGDREVPRGAPHLGAADEGALRREEPALVADALPLADGRRLAHRAAAGNNIVRTAIQALAAVLGGTQSLHTNSMDETLALPTEDAVRIALRTQQIIAYESGVVEHDRPARRLVLRRGPHEPAGARGARVLRRIDELGGMVAAIRRLLPARDRRASFRFQRRWRPASG